MTTVEKTKQLIKIMRAQGDSEEQIALVIGIDVEGVREYLHQERCKTAAISNEEDLVQTMWAQGKTEDEIAGILDIDVRQVHAFLERQ